MAEKLSRLPLSGIKVLELAGLAPVPFAGMILSDFGAQVTRIGKPNDPMPDVFARGKRSVCIDLKHLKGIEILKRLNKNNDILIEPFRPGVMEKLGLGPDVLCKENKRLIYVRLNGYGTQGSMAQKAGHDINYLAISGILSRLASNEQNPNPPINLLGDFGGGSLVAVVGIMMALFERSISGEGQVVESSITEGTAYLSSFLHRSNNFGIWFGKPGNSLLDGGAPFYQTYETKDNRYMAVGAIEPQFYKEFIDKLDDNNCLQNQMDMLSWPHMKDHISGIFKLKTQSEWISIFKDTDACVTPVLEFTEAPLHSHNIENETFMKNEATGDFEPCPAPKLSRTPGISYVRKTPMPGENTEEFLLEEGFSKEEIYSMVSEGIVDISFPKSSL